MQEEKTTDADQPLEEPATVSDAEAGQSPVETSVPAPEGEMPAPESIPEEGEERGGDQGSAPSSTPDDRDEAASAADDAMPSWPEVAGKLDRLDARLAAIEETVTGRLARDQAREKMFDAVHDELQQHRKDAYRQSVKRLLQALLIFHDNVKTAHDNASGDVRSELEYVLDDLLGVLYSQGVEPVPVEIGERFDGKRHRATRRVSTPEADGDRTVGHTGRTGFTWDDKVLRPAEVHVLRYEGPPVDDQGSSPAPETESAGGEKADGSEGATANGE